MFAISFEYCRYPTYAARPPQKEQKPSSARKTSEVGEAGKEEKGRLAKVEEMMNNLKFIINSCRPHRLATELFARLRISGLFGIFMQMCKLPSDTFSAAALNLKLHVIFLNVDSSTAIITHDACELVSAQLFEVAYLRCLAPHGPLSCSTELEPSAKLSFAVGFLRLRPRVSEGRQVQFQKLRLNLRHSLLSSSPGVWML